MTDQHDEERQRGRRWAWGALLVVWAVLYVLSFGPIMGAYWNSTEPIWLFSWLVEVPYCPLLSFAFVEDGNAIQSAYLEYILWWMGV